MSTVIDDQWADSGGHWYAKDGSPQYRIIGANGKERNTTLRDARKLGYLPSVTTILQMEAKPQLTTWLVQQGMLACLTLPRYQGEDDQSFMARALQDSKQQVRQAAARGSYLHGLLEEHVRHGYMPFRATDDDLPYIEPVIQWLDSHFAGYAWHVERSFASQDGYAGKLDLTGTHPTLPPVVLDYKCKDFRDPDKKLAYDEHVTQLAAYHHGLYPDAAERICVNLFISSTEPGLIVPLVWEADEIARGHRAFMSLLALWKCRKKLD